MSKNPNEDIIEEFNEKEFTENQDNNCRNIVACCLCAFLLFMIILIGIFSYLRTQNNLLN